MLKKKRLEAEAEMWDSMLKKRLEAEAEMWDSMLKKRLEAEAEMWDLWRMGEEEEAVSAEDTDFACRCVKKPEKSNRIESNKISLKDIVKQLLQCVKRSEK